MNDKPEIKPQGISPLKHICMTIGELPSSYLETMTYYEMLLWFTKFLQERMIPTLDNNALAVEELQGLFIELQNYVNNYFDNLDVQDEINNKLDEMLEQGVLEQIIEQYLNSSAIWGFDNVADMKEASNLIDGSYAKTLGFYEKNDGGKALYKIRTITNADIVDNASIIALNNENLIAELIIKNEITPEIFGAKGDGLEDDSSKILETFNYAKDNELTLILNKTYLINTPITLNGNGKEININMSGYFIPNKQIDITNIINSDLKIHLKDSGNNDSSEYGVVFSKLKYCYLDLLAENVKKTAFYIYSSRTAQSTCNWCNVKIKGTNNTKTLLHGVLGYTVPDNGAFGCYEDIEDHNPSEPITFRSSSDITILHFENEFNDGTWTKNSLEFLYCGLIHCSHIACGANAKNLIYLQSSRVFIDNVFVLAEDKTNGELNIPSNVTGVYATGGGSIKINNITNHGCKYAIDMSSMTDQGCLDSYIYNVYNMYDENVEQRRGGIYCPKISNDILYTYNDLNKGVLNYSSYITYNEKLSINNSAIVKNDNQVNIHVDFNVINANISQNDTIISINTSLLKEALNSSGIIYDRTNNVVRGLATLQNNSFQIKTTASLISGDRYDLNISFYLKKSKLQQL